jgi:hypothetical protein
MQLPTIHLQVIMGKDLVHVAIESDLHDYSKCLRLWARWKDARGQDCSEILTTTLNPYWLPLLGEGYFTMSHYAHKEILEALRKENLAHPSGEMLQLEPVWKLNREEWSRLVLLFDPANL